ncbi:MAG: glutathione S-transferase family protein [Defluviicoccus sp.]|nr:glutathione S-transferase family protein [Defluviicoccus sp.]MDE0384720.1 glutathione S-transferase family protein [Defluviicoccus sp.]
MLTLYHQGSSVCAAKVRIAFHEKGLDWRGVVVDVLKGEQFQDWYLALNPNAVVPTLEDDGRVIVESTVICEYLDETRPDPPLRPADAYHTARMRVWTKRIDERLHPMTSALTYAASHRHAILDNNTPEQVEALVAETRDPVKRARKREWIEHGIEAPSARAAVAEFDNTLADMEAALAEAEWLAGDSYSLADIGMTPYVNRLAMLGMEGFWDARPRVAGWFARIRARPSFAPALIDPVPDELARSLAANGARSWPAVAEMLEAGRKGGG